MLTICKPHDGNFALPFSFGNFGVLLYSASHCYITMDSQLSNHPEFCFQNILTITEIKMGQKQLSTISNLHRRRLFIEVNKPFSSFALLL
jgi:hypothetical protein